MTGATSMSGVTPCIMAAHDMHTMLLSAHMAVEQLRAPRAIVVACDMWYALAGTLRVR